VEKIRTVETAIPTTMSLIPTGMYAGDNPSLTSGVDPTTLYADMRVFEYIRRSGAPDAPSHAQLTIQHMNVSDLHTLKWVRAIRMVVHGTAVAEWPTVLEHRSTVGVETHAKPESARR